MRHRPEGKMEWTLEPEGETDNPFFEREENPLMPKVTAIDFSFKWNYAPPTPDVWYLSNGDPGYPGDPEEIEIWDFEVKCLDEDAAPAPGSFTRKPTPEETKTILDYLNGLDYESPLYERILDRVRSEVAERYEPVDRDPPDWE